MSLDPARETDAHFRPSRWGRVGVFVFGYLLLAGVVILEFVPPTPRTFFGWLAILLFGPPIYLVTWYLSDQVVEKWPERTALQKIVKAFCFIVFALGLIVAYVLVTGGAAAG